MSQITPNQADYIIKCVREIRALDYLATMPDPNKAATKAAADSLDLQLERFVAHISVGES